MVISFFNFSMISMISAWLELSRELVASSNIKILTCLAKAITAAGGLSKEEIEKMRKDAEAHAAEDERRHAEVEERNKADGLAFQVEKTLKDAGDKIAADKKAPVEAALKDLKDALAKQPPAPIDEIKSKQEALMKAMEPVAQEMYSSAQQPGAGTPPPGAGTPPPQDEPKKEKGGDDVVDADFTMK